MKNNDISFNLINVLINLTIILNQNNNKLNKLSIKSNKSKNSTQEYKSVLLESYLRKRLNTEQIIREMNTLKDQSFKYEAATKILNIQMREYISDGDCHHLERVIIEKDFTKYKNENLGAMTKYHEYKDDCFEFTKDQYKTCKDLDKKGYQHRSLFKNTINCQKKFCSSALSMIGLDKFVQNRYQIGNTFGQFCIVLKPTLEAVKILSKDWKKYDRIHN